MTKPLLLSAILALGPLFTTVTAGGALPDHEWRMIRKVAADYRLSADETLLLAAIRVVENGRPGLEFGVGGPMDSGHMAHRYRDGVKSFLIQCAWAAGTIRKRYTGDLEAFGRRYNPLHAKSWTWKIDSVIRRLRRERARRN